HVTVEDTSHNGYMYLTEDSLKGFFRDRKPYTTVTFLKEAGYEVKIISPVSLEISDKMHTFEIVSTDIALLSAAMHRKGWNIIEEDEE
ncbi:MAG: hypothetical protein J6R42_00760, partial [Clostridia bacterium]|nr:hypothetical protein [Clostridia bacterium]